MTGGTVVEVRSVPLRGNCIQVKCRHETNSKGYLTVICERPPSKLGYILYGDTLKWKGRYCYWTPKTGRLVSYRLRNLSGMTVKQRDTESDSSW